MEDIRVYLPVNRSYKINIGILKHLMIDLTCMIHDPARYCEIIIICGIPIFVDIVDPQIYISTKIGIHEFKWFGFVVLNATFNNIHLYHGCQFY